MLAFSGASLVTDLFLFQQIQRHYQKANATSQGRDSLEYIALTPSRQCNEDKIHLIDYKTLYRLDLAGCANTSRLSIRDYLLIILQFNALLRKLLCSSLGPETSLDRLRRTRLRNSSPRCDCFMLYHKIASNHPTECMTP